MAPWAVEDIAWEQITAAVHETWLALLVARDLNPSMSPEWIEAAARAHGGYQRLRVFLVRDGERVVGLIPFFRGRTRVLGVPLPTVELAGNFVSYHQEIVASEKEERVLGAFLAHQMQGGARVISALNLVRGGATEAALRQWAKRMNAAMIYYEGERSPYLPIRTSWEEYLAGKSAEFRYLIRRKERRVKREASAELRWYSTAQDCPTLLSSMLAIEASSWKARAGTAVTERSQERAYYDTLLPWLASRGMLLANVLHLSGAPIAYSLCYAFNGRVGQLKTAFNEAYASLSPGLLVTVATIRRAFEDRCREFDFHGDDMQHKLAWTDLSRSHAACLVYGGGRVGRTLGEVNARVHAWRHVLRVWGNSAEFTQALRRKYVD